ncbi:MAG: SGNH/GDSL hydrolase family protein [Bacteroidetes bacterium]|nr:SGNH/GDSL hydrolase family protein [Bacteroidota bacterium]
MKSIRSNIVSALAVGLVAFVVASCGDFKKSSVVNPPSNGSVDFSMYVSLGNSLTAGYQGGALYESAQEYSYPAEIAKQAGVTQFEQPLISDPGIGGRMKILNLSGPVIGEDPAIGGAPLNSGLTRPYNNLGVPGAVLYDMIDTSSFAAKAGPPRNNPFFQIVLRSAALGNSPVAQALALHPTFVSVWIGANDVLGYATSGGTVGTLGPGTGPTNVATFTALYDQMMSTLLAGAPNAKFVVANIPDVAAVPFFTTVPAVVVNPATQQPVLNPQTGQPIPLIVYRHDASGNLYAGPADPQHDFILLTALDSLEAGVGIPTAVGGTGRPLPNQFVLDSYEIGITEQAIQGYNQAIGAFAASHPDKIALVDAYAVFNQFAKTGDVEQGVDLTNSYITGGFFGLDGIHPTSQGYAFVANIFIQAINKQFGANIPIVPISLVPSSIVLAPTGLGKVLWPDVHYSALKPAIELLQARSY